MYTFTGIQHIALATGDMDCTIRFWRDLLGMRLVAGLGKPGARQYFFQICPGAMIAFFEWPSVRPIPEKDHGTPTKGPFAFDHVAFALNDTEELWKIKSRLEEAGFWVSEAMDHGFIHSIYAFDPNGIPLEFSVMVPGVDLNDQPQMKDRSPSAVTLEGPAPQTHAWRTAAGSENTDDDRFVYPGEGTELLDATRKNWFTPKSK